MSPLRAIYVGLAAIIALAVWFVVKTRDPSKPATCEKVLIAPPTRRHELFEARNRIRRQIETLDISPHLYGRPANEARNELKGLLDAIESELKEG